MRFIIPTLSPVLRNSPSSLVMQGSAIIATLLLGSGMACAEVSAQSPAPQAAQKPAQHSRSQASHKIVKPVQAETPPPPPLPNWPANDRPGRASVTWDSHGLRIDAANSSLHQILSDISVQTGTKVEGMGADQRVYGAYGPGQAREVLAQLLQGSGYNVLLAGDLGSGVPRQLLLSPRHNGAASPASAGGAATQGNNPDDDIPDNEVEEQLPPPPPPQQPIPMQANPNPARPGFGPNGPIRTPQQVMEEMQRQQLLQQQQQQQQEGQPNNPPE